MPHYPNHSHSSGAAFGRLPPASGVFVPNGRPWTPHEEAVVRDRPPRDAAGPTGRSIGAVYNRRYTFGLQRVGAARPA
jgi:hypothetical protein